MTVVEAVILWCFAYALTMLDVCHGIRYNMRNLPITKSEIEKYFYYGGKMVIRYLTFLIFTVLYINTVFSVLDHMLATICEIDDIDFNII